MNDLKKVVMLYFYISEKFLLGPRFHSRQCGICQFLQNPSDLGTLLYVSRNCISSAFSCLVTNF